MFDRLLGGSDIERSLAWPCSWIKCTGQCKRAADGTCRRCRAAGPFATDAQLKPLLRAVKGGMTADLLKQVTPGAAILLC